jgi:hypothetical protein
MPEYLDIANNQRIIVMNISDGSYCVIEISEFLIK